MGVTPGGEMKPGEQMQPGSNMQPGTETGMQRIRRSQPARTGSAGRLGADRGRARRLLVHADKDVEPPLLAVLVDLTLADEEARVQPAPPFGFRRQLDSGEDGAPVAGRVLFDALAMDGHEDLVARGRRDRPAQVRRPDAVLASPRVVRPHDRALELARDHPSPWPKPRPSSPPYGRCQLRGAVEGVETRQKGSSRRAPARPAGTGGRVRAASPPRPRGPWAAGCRHELVDEPLGGVGDGVHRTGESLLVRAAKAS